MPATRDIIEEIIQVRSRLKSNYAMSELLGRLSGLERVFARRGELDVELLAYFPVALVACLEGYFRLAIKELIDAGVPYLNRAVRLLGNAKVDFDIVRALHGKQVTIGEFIAHSVPLSRLSHINTALSTLLDVDFLAELRTVTDRWSVEVRGNPKVPILSEADETYAAVSRTFEIRHIICHEVASAYVIEVSDIERCFAATALFLKAADELHSQTLQPDAPLTQAAMNMKAAADLDAALKEVDVLNETIRERLEGSSVEEFAEADAASVEEFGEAHAAWVGYMESWAQFEAGLYRGGSIAPTIYGGAATAIAHARIDQLKKHLRLYEELWSLSVTK